MFILSNKFCQQSQKNVPGIWQITLLVTPPDGYHLVMKTNLGGHGSIQIFKTVQNESIAMPDVMHISIFPNTINMNDHPQYQYNLLI